MIAKITFHIAAWWAPRAESPAALTRRWLATAQRLQSIYPTMKRWYKGVNNVGIEVVLDESAIEKDIAEGTVDDGYMFWVRSDQSGHGPRMFHFDMTAGSNFNNAVGLSTDYFVEPDPSICTYRIFKPALLAIAEEFDAERAFAYPSSLSALWQRPENTNPPFHIAWISYVAPRVAHLVTQPPTALVEHRANGGIVLTATDETFDVGNPAHMSVARDIERATAPLHLRPWEPEA